MLPINKVNEWLDKEKNLGSPCPENLVLATVSEDGKPRSRVVYMREISAKGILFFTQKETKKVLDLAKNRFASMTLWLPLQEREVVFDGETEKLESTENKYYWESLPRERQLRFIVNSFKARNPPLSLNSLNRKYDMLVEKFYEKTIPMSDCYYGYCFMPHNIYFYTLVENGFSEVETFSSLD